MQAGSRLGSQPSSPVWPRQPSCWAPCTSQSAHPVPLPYAQASWYLQTVECWGFLPPGCPLLPPRSPCSKWKMAPPPGQAPPPSVLSCSSFNLPDYIHGGPPGFAAVQRFTKTLTHPSSELAVPQPHMLRQLFPLILLSPCTPLPLWQGYCLFHSFLHISALAEAQLYLPPPGSSP